MASSGTRHGDRHDDRRDERRAERAERRNERRAERHGDHREERRAERRTERDERRAERRAERHDHPGDDQRENHRDERKRAYHHGDLRNALIAAAAELAAQGGPGSVAIRAAARLVGVTPTAAYRHFAGHEDLLGAARARALDELMESMHKQLAARPRSTDPVRYALGSLAAVGRGYIAFAQAQPGLFRTVFAREGPTRVPGDSSSDDPFSLLLESLDELVAVGYLSVERRPLAEVAAWSMVHGLAMLLDGPLRDMPPEVREDAIVKAMLILGHGLSGSGLTPEQETLLAEDMRTAG